MSVALALRAFAEWDESKHPRDDDGKFTDAGGDGGISDRTEAGRGLRTVKNVLRDRQPALKANVLDRAVTRFATLTKSPLEALRVGFDNVGGGVEMTVGGAAPGASMRMVFKERDGQPVVYMGYLGVPYVEQGTGAGTQIWDGLMQDFREMGVRQVELTATSGRGMVGGYVWAKKGVQFLNDDDRENTAAAFRAFLSSVGAPLPAKIETPKDIADYTVPLPEALEDRVSRMAPRDHFPIGKRWLLAEFVTGNDTVEWGGRVRL